MCDLRCPKRKLNVPTLPALIEEPTPTLNKMKCQVLHYNGMAGVTSWHNIYLRGVSRYIDMQGFHVVGLGASAGGHQALREFFGNLPHPSEMSFVVVTHLRRDHFSILDRIISKFTRMPVVRITGGEIIKANHVYVMPENVNVQVRRRTLFLRPRGEDHKIHKPIDVFFQSLAEDTREKAVGIIFSGMGNDGFEGAQAIHHHGGMVLVQDPRSTEFKSMPESIIKDDSPDVILPPSELASRLTLLISEKRSVENR